MSVSMTVMTRVCVGHAEKTACIFLSLLPLLLSISTEVPSTVYFAQGLSDGSDFLWLILLVEVLARRLRIWGVVM